jgi:hypothetical protein
MRPKTDRKVDFFLWGFPICAWEGSLAAEPLKGLTCLACGVGISCDVVVDSGSCTGTDAFVSLSWAGSRGGVGSRSSFPVPPKPMGTAIPTLGVLIGNSSSISGIGADILPRIDEPRGGSTGPDPVPLDFLIEYFSTRPLLAVGFKLAMIVKEKGARAARVQRNVTSVGGKDCGEAQRL